VGGGRNQISFNQNNQGTSRHSNQVLPAYKSLPLRHPSQRSCEIWGFNSGGDNDRRLLRHAVSTLLNSVASGPTWTWMHYAPPKLQLFTSLYGVTYQKVWLFIPLLFKKRFKHRDSNRIHSLPLRWHSELPSVSHQVSADVWSIVVGSDRRSTSTFVSTYDIRSSKSLSTSFITGCKTRNTPPFLSFYSTPCQAKSCCVHFCPSL